MALIAIFLLTLVPVRSKMLHEEQKVQGRVANEGFGFAVTIPPGRTATRVQNIKTLFISVSLPKPVNIEIHAELDPNPEEKFDARIQGYLKLMRESGETDIALSDPQDVLLGNLRGARYRIHFNKADGKSADVIWIQARRTIQKPDRRVIIVQVTLGGDSSDVTEYESELNLVTGSFEWFDSPVTPHNKRMQQSLQASFVVTADITCTPADARR